MVNHMDEKLIQFADERQAEILRELIASGSQSEAARKLGIGRSSVKRAIDAVQRKAADMRHHVPPRSWRVGADYDQHRSDSVKFRLTRRVVSAII